MLGYKYMPPFTVMGLSLLHGPLWVNFPPHPHSLLLWKLADQSVHLNTTRSPIYALPPASYSPPSSLIPSTYNSIQAPNVFGESRRNVVSLSETYIHSLAGA